MELITLTFSYQKQNLCPILSNLIIYSHSITHLILPVIPTRMPSLTTAFQIPNAFISQVSIFFVTLATIFSSFDKFTVAR